MCLDRVHKEQVWGGNKNTKRGKHKQAILERTNSKESTIIFFSSSQNENH